MPKYTKARKGYKFAITELGLEVNHVASKYKRSYENRTQYETSVPNSWVEKGYVEEVERCEK